MSPRSLRAIPFLLALFIAGCAKSAPPQAVAPTAASSAGCHVRSDCKGGLACVYEPGCDAPVGHCATIEPVECRASTPIATCSGEPLSACRNAGVEIPFFAFAEETALVDIGSLMGKVASVTVHRAPENVLADVAMTPERLEAVTQYEHRTSSDAEVARRAIDIFRIAAAQPGSAPPDLRLELVLFGADGRRLASLGIDAFGDKGALNGTPVTFRHHGGLAAVRALAQKLSGKPR